MKKAANTMCLLLFLVVKKDLFRNNQLFNNLFMIWGEIQPNG
jgi:hypothetical protein